jgi:hypothetical protein
MTSPPPLADTSDMIGLHRVFRDACRLGPAMIRDADTADAARIETVGTYLDNVLRLLHVHHESEDELMTPRLLDRGAQHESVLASIGAAERAIAGWRSRPTADTAAVAVETLGALHVELIRHLDDEEQIVLPIAARHLTAPEWGELPGHGMRAFSGDKLWLVLGLIQEQMTAGQIAQMEAHMPPPLAEFWTGPGRPMYTEFAGALRG